HPSGSCPAYIAISHTWESKLFPPPPCYPNSVFNNEPHPAPPPPAHQQLPVTPSSSSPASLPQFSHVPGYPLLQSAMHSHSFDTIEYVWVDTWCIIQTDPN